MGAQKYANNVYTTQLSDSQGRNRTFYATMTNMYFSVGTMSVKNVTSGWDFSASKPGTPKIALNRVSAGAVSQQRKPRQSRKNNK
jgi:hypothetical protein